MSILYSHVDQWFMWHSDITTRAWYHRHRLSMSMPNSPVPTQIKIEGLMTVLLAKTEVKPHFYLCPTNWVIQQWSPIQSIHQSINEQLPCPSQTMPIIKVGHTHRLSTTIVSTSTMDMTMKSISTEYQSAAMSILEIKSLEEIMGNYHKCIELDTYMS